MEKNVNLDIRIELAKEIIMQNEHNKSILKSIVNDMFEAEMYRKKIAKNECKKVCDCN